MNYNKNINRELLITESIILSKLQNEEGFAKMQDLIIGKKNQ